ncbi:toll/interleukin-1 receptor domain-containing protein, partial [Frankia sp. AgB1.9]|uniref:toll/interleukin-1 receptor domain-containing protein n=2 Tax=unclassified Frankia TaxID=2632575 RepID=UPI0027DC526C
MTQRFFVSYTGVDVRWAEWVAWTLEAAGHEALIQAWDFGPGSHFVGEMQKALGGDRRTVAVVSAAYLTSVFATEEWQAVWAADPAGARRLLLVVRVQDCERPGLLRQIVSVDVFGVDEGVARNRLLSAVALGRRKPAVAPGFPVSGDGGRSAGAGVAPVFPVDLPAVWNVPPRLARFVGREALLAGVAEELAAWGVAAVCAVQGAGGMGKTALAVEYAHRHMDDFDVVWWVPGQNAELAAGQVAALGVALGLGEGADWVAVAGQLRRLGARWLVVVDNV